MEPIKTEPRKFPNMVEATKWEAQVWSMITQLGLENYALVVKGPARGQYGNLDGFQVYIRLD